ncbi:MICOS complex subunit Mic60 [Halyomorpha halys]|uniref:MICOS complex subunit Mic60 n=1 Tax=Halyomorpha halys TaxID=286706 RepID=UPI0006D526A4|nr:MICOS complex subunit Mic60 isoform X2 [Halyomorpha halys]
MFRHSVKFPLSIVRKYPLYVERQYVVRLYRTSAPVYRKQIEGQKEECPQEKSGKLFYYTLGAVIIGTGAVVAYAKHDEDFRALLREYVPGSDEFISFITAEETSPIDYLLRVISDLAASLKREVMTMFGQESGKKELPPCDDKQQPYVPPKPIFKDMNLKGDKTDEKRIYVKKPDGEVDITPVPDTSIPKSGDSLNPRDLKELEEAINDASTVAVKTYTDAICALRDLAEDIYQLVDSSIESVDSRIWSKIKKKTEERERLIAEADMALKTATENSKKFRAMLDDPAFPGDEDTKNAVKRSIRRNSDAVVNAKKTYEQEVKRASITEKYWSKVLEARKNFNDEIETLFPNVRINDKKANFNEGEMDLFFLYTYQMVLFYQKELNKLDTLGNLRLIQALEQSKLGDPLAIDAAIEQEVDKERRKIGLEFQKRLLNVKVDCEKAMRVQLKRQAEAHSDHLAEVVDMKEKELDRKMNRMLDEKLHEERMKFKEEVAAMVARLRGIDDVMKCRAASDRKARASQALWAACQALEAALRGPGGSVPPAEEVMKPLENEVNLILKAGAPDDEMVDAVVASIPQEARLRGVYPDSVLRNRFLNVERVAKRVALLPDGGASLPIMLLSYIQSFFIINPANPIPPKELANQPVEVGKFNTFEILQRARYWVDRGDFAQALRYMLLLEGAPHVVAKDWINETRIFLETQQAAIALMAHASAAGLAYS